jgi:hypothetical protein
MIDILAGFLNGSGIYSIKLHGRRSDSVYTLCRKTDAGLLWLIANTDADRPFKGNVSFERRKAVLLDAETGYCSIKDGSGTDLLLAPADSLLALVPDDANAWPMAEAPGKISCAEVSVIDPESWAFLAAEPNALPLRRWDFSIIQAGMTTEYTYCSTVQSCVTLEDICIVLDDIENRSAVMGKAEIEVSLNGRACEPAGWHVDKAFKKFKAHGFRKGKNLLKITIRHAAWSGEPHLLTSYTVLLGRFSLKKDGPEWVVAPEPGEIRLNSWDSQGYPFYSGQASYSKRVEMPSSGNLSLELEAVYGGAKLELDGEDAGTRLWAPWRWEIPAGKTGKATEIKLTVTNTLANYLGEQCCSGPVGRMRLISYKR